MNNKFSSFKPSSDMHESNKNHNESISKNNDSNIKNLEDKIDKYSTLSKQELMDEFLKQTLKQTQSGNLTTDKIDMYRNTLYPYLNDSQKQVFENLMGTVKNVRED